MFAALGFRTHRRAPPAGIKQGAFANMLLFLINIIYLYCCKGIKKKIDPIENSHRFYLRQKEDIENICKDARRVATIDYISKEGSYPAWSGTSSKYFERGERFFDSMIDDIKNAKLCFLI